MHKQQFIYFMLPNSYNKQPYQWASHIVAQKQPQSRSG